MVQSVDPGSEVERAGLKRGDVIVQLDGRRLTDLVGDVIAQMKPGQQFELTVRRVSQVIEIKSTVATREETEYRIVEVPNAAPEQLKVRSGWLEGTNSSATDH